LGEVVGDAAAALDPENIADMQTQLTRLAADPAARARWRSKGLAHSARFTWQHPVAATLTVYARAAARLQPGCLRPVPSTILKRESP
jgi:hypothetical protein